ncbi:hypothetical protein [Aliivibrio wodanis]|uniref:hypothetical protein n=2 Tax=Aliivibrio wodanis TaxID=80852 RepID=UPI00406C71EF
MEPIAVSISMIKPFLGFFKRTNPAFNTLVVGQRVDNQHLFAVALTENPAIAGYIIYPATTLSFWRRFTMRKEYILVTKIENDMSIDTNQFFSKDHPFTPKERATYQKHGYKVIVKAQMRDYHIKERFDLK